MNRSRPAKIAAWTAAVLLSVLALGAAAVLVIANTQTGRGFIERATAALTHGQVRLAGIHGSLPATIELDQLQLRDSHGVWLWANHLSVHWSPGALLTHHVKVGALHIALLHIERLRVSDTSEPSHTPSVPHTDIDELVIDTLELGKALAGEPASLAVHASAHIRSLKEASAHLSVQRIAGDGHYQVDAHFDPQSMTATVQLQEPAHGPLANLVNLPNAGALNVRATLKGPRSAEDLQLRAAAGPLQGQASGRINLQAGAADLSYFLTAPQMSPSDALAWQRIDLRGQLHGPFTKLTAEGALLIEALQLPGGIHLTQLKARLTGNRGVITLQALIGGLQGPAPVSGLFAGSPLIVDAAAHLDEPQRPVHLTVRHPLLSADANAVTAAPQSADLTLRVPNLKPFASLSGAPIAGDAQVVAHLDYAPAMSRLTATLSSHLDGGDAAWAGLVRGGLTQMQSTIEVTAGQVALKKLQLSAKAVSFTADGHADRSAHQQVTGRFDLIVPDLHRAATALAGDLKLSGSIEGTAHRLSADTRLTAHLSVRGSPRGTVSAHLQAKDLPQSPQGLLEATGDVDGAPLRVHAELQPVSNGRYHAIIREARWKSAYADGEVTWGGAVTNARGSVRFGLSQLADLSILAGRTLSGSVSGQMTLGAQAGGPTALLDIQAHNVATGGVTANARLHGEGSMKALNITLAADSPAVAGSPARLNAAALVDLNAKRLQLTKVDAAYHQQALHLLTPAALQFSSGLALQHLKLGIGNATVALDGQIAPALDVHATLRHLDAALIDAFVPGLLASGTASVDAALRGTPTAPTGTVQVQALDVRMQNPGAQGLPAAALRADARLRGDAADIDARLSSGGSVLALSGNAPLTSAGSANLKLAGNVDLALANPILEARGRHLTGTLAINTTVTGTRAAPQVAGTVRLSNGSARDYTQGISLTEVNGELSGDHGVLRITQMSARAAPGTISIQGTVGVLQPKIPVDLTLTARNAQPIASNIVTANLNANMQLSGALREQLNLTGSVHLNHANITIPGGLPPEVAVLDVERDGAPPPPAPSPLVINLHLDVDAPNRILVNGRGLDAEMGGELHIRGTTATPLINGGFALQRGFFTLASSKLTFTSGTVTFNGSGVQKSLDPSLDFAAQTQVAGVTAIVHITGLADAPRIELTSTPELPSDEILSRLLFGEPAAELTAIQVVEMGAALASLRGGGNGPSLNPLTRIQKALGLDRLSVGSAASTAASTEQSTGYTVAAGRYVSSRVYVGVKEGTTGSSQVEVDVDLTKNLKLQSQLGNGTATAQGVTPENDPGSRLGLAYQFEY